MLLRFRHVFNYYNKIRLINILKNIFISNNLTKKIMSITTNNVNNNDIIYKNLIKTINEHNTFLIQNSQKKIYFVYIIQLTLKKLFKKIRITLKIKN